MDAGPTLHLLLVPIWASSPAHTEPFLLRHMDIGKLANKSHIVNFDEHDSADEDTVDYVTKEADDAEKEGHDTGKPGSFLNRLILHGNKKTEEQIAREVAAANRQAGAGDKVVVQR